MSESDLFSFALIMSRTNVTNPLRRQLAILVCILRSNDIDNFDDSLAALARIHSNLGHLAAHKLLPCFDVLL